MPAPRDVHDSLDQWADGLISLSELLMAIFVYLDMIEPDSVNLDGTYRNRHN